VGFSLRSDDAGAHLSWPITVLTLRGQHVAGLTSFIGSDHVVAFGRPASLPWPSGDAQARAAR
jgi:RNA polymerase sigma-70 factor (ECF subfamily)